MMPLVFHHLLIIFKPFLSKRIYVYSDTSESLLEFIDCSCHHLHLLEDLLSYEYDLKRLCGLYLASLNFSFKTKNIFYWNIIKESTC